jgi:hypothetical protein
MKDAKAAAMNMAYERKQLEERLKREEEKLVARFKAAEEEWAKERKKMFEELKSNKRPPPQVIVKQAIDTSVPKRRIKAKPKEVVRSPSPEKRVVELATTTCQTEVNDDGLWQKQDGWVINVSAPSCAAVSDASFSRSAQQAIPGASKPQRAYHGSARAACHGSEHHGSERTTGDRA